jgi:hypothetical protein
VTDTPETERLRASVQDWLDRADTWDNWPEVEAAFMQIIKVTNDLVPDARGDWSTGFRDCARMVRGAMLRALGIEESGG